MADRSVKVTLHLNSSQYQSALRQAGNETQNLARSTDKAGLSLKSLLKVVAGSTAALGLAKLAQGAVTLEAAYSKTMAQVAVATNAPKRELAELDALALKMGQDTVFSAQDSAQAMLELAKGGLSTAQIKAGALANSLTLAAAGGLDLGDAANSVVNTMGAFGLSATQTSGAVAALAGAANASSANVSDITEALAQAGAQAHASGLSVQETTAFLAEFANAGIKGSDAGTSLKTALQSLVPQTQKQRDEMERLHLSFLDANGNFVDATQIAGRLQGALKGMSEGQRAATLQTLFGSDASRAANIIASQGADGLKKYIKQTSDLTQAQKLAQAGMSGTSGALESLKGTIETAQIQLGKGLAPQVQKLATAGNDLIQNVDFEAWGTQFASGVETAIHQLTPFVNSLTAAAEDSLPAVKTGLEITAASAKLLLDAVKPILDVFDGMPDGAQKMIVLGGAALYLGRSFETAADGSQRLALKSTALKGALGASGLALAAYASTSDSVDSSTGALLTTLGGAAAGFAVGGPWGAAIGGGVGLLSAFGRESDKSSDAQKRLATAGQAVADTLNNQNGALTENTRRQAIAQLAKSGTLRAGDKYGISFGDTVNASLGDAAAQTRVNNAVGEYLKLQKQKGKLDKDDLVAAADYLNALGANRDALKKQRAAISDANQATRDQAGAFGLVSDELVVASGDSKKYAGALGTIPDDVRTRILADGAKASKADVQALAKAYGLTPKQVRTVLEAQVGGAKKNLRDVGKALNDIDNTVAKPSVDLDISPAEAALRSIQRKINGLHGTTAPINAGLFGLNKAMGGQVVGPGTGTSDDIPARLSNGEHVLTASDVLKMGGQGSVYRLRAAAQAGLLPAFAKGGAVDTRSLEQLRAQQDVNDLEDSLDEKVKRGKHKGEHALRGLARKIAVAELKEARQALRDIKSGKDARDSAADDAAGVGNSLGGGFSLGGFGGKDQYGFTKKVSSSDIVAGASAFASKLKSFAGKLEKAKELGIPPVMLTEIANLGVEEGTQVIDALIAAPPSDIKALQDAYRNIAGFGNRAGSVVTGASGSASAAGTTAARVYTASSAGTAAVAGFDYDLMAEANARRKIALLVSDRQAGYIVDAGTKAKKDKK